MSSSSPVSPQSSLGALLGDDGQERITLSGTVSRKLGYVAFINGDVYVPAAVVQGSGIQLKQGDEVECECVPHSDNHGNKWRAVSIQLKGESKIQNEKSQRILKGDIERELKSVERICEFIFRLSKSQPPPHNLGSVGSFIARNPDVKESIAIPLGEFVLRFPQIFHVTKDGSTTFIDLQPTMIKNSDDGTELNRELNRPVLRALLAKIRAQGLSSSKRDDRFICAAIAKHLCALDAKSGTIRRHELADIGTFLTKLRLNVGKLSNWVTASPAAQRAFDVSTLKGGGVQVAVKREFAESIGIKTPSLDGDGNPITDLEIDESPMSWADLVTGRSPALSRRSFSESPSVWDSPSTLARDLGSQSPFHGIPEDFGAFDEARMSDLLEASSEERKESAIKLWEAGDESKQFRESFDAASSAIQAISDIDRLDLDFEGSGPSLFGALPEFRTRDRSISEPNVSAFLPAIAPPMLAVAGLGSSLGPSSISSAGGLPLRMSPLTMGGPMPTSRPPTALKTDDSPWMLMGHHPPPLPPLLPPPPQPLLSHKLSAAADVEGFLSLFPISLQKVIMSLPASVVRENLIDIILDVGRLPEARIYDSSISDRAIIADLSNDPVEREMIESVVNAIGKEFEDDNAIQSKASLHRVSCIKNAAGEVIGLTCRIGRAVPGCAGMLMDLMQSNKSILVLGPACVGKTTILRELARVISSDLGRHVLVIDTWGEMAGSGDVSHYGIGKARRVQVPNRADQSTILLQAAHNHGPSVIIIDEVSMPEEQQAVAKLVQRGITVIAGVQCGSLPQLLFQRNVLLPLSSEMIPLIDKEIQWQHCIPVFQVAVEMQDRSALLVHHDLWSSVQALLSGTSPVVDQRVTGSAAQPANSRVAIAG